MTKNKIKYIPKLREQFALRQKLITMSFTLQLVSAMVFLAFKIAAWRINKSQLPLNGQACTLGARDCTTARPGAHGIITTISGWSLTSCGRPKWEELPYKGGLMCTSGSLGSYCIPVKTMFTGMCTDTRIMTRWRMAVRDLFLNVLQFTISNSLLQSRGGGGTCRKIGWGCAARFLKSLPYFRPTKSVIFPTLFQIWSKIWYPISDLTLKSISYFRPAL